MNKEKYIKYLEIRKEYRKLAQKVICHGLHKAYIRIHKVKDE